MPALTWDIVAGLIAKYGVPFVEQLIANIQNKAPVTAVEWNALTAKINTSFDSLVPKQP